MKSIFKTANPLVVNQVSQDSKFSGANRVFLEFNESFPNVNKEGQREDNSHSFGVSFDNIFKANIIGKVGKIMKAMRVGRSLSPSIAGLLLTNAKVEFEIFEVNKNEVFNGKVIEENTIATKIISVEPDNEFSSILLELRDEWFIDKPTINANDKNIYANI